MNWHTEPWPAPIPVCSVDGCRDDDVFARGWCRPHYNDWRQQQMPTCSIEDCTNKVHSRGWCNAHYQRWYQHGDPLHQPPRREKKPRTPTNPRPVRPPCSIEGCDRPNNGRGWCKLHYRRWSLYGDPLGSARSKMSTQERRERKREQRRQSSLKLTPEQKRERYRRWYLQQTPEKLAEMYDEKCQWRERNRDYVRREAAKAKAKLNKIPGPRNHQPWTPAENAIAMRYDITLPEMCRMLGRSYHAVTNHRAQLKKDGNGLVSRKKTERIRRNNHIRALHAAGHDTLDIMVLTGHTRDIVQYTIHHARD